jgi:hypothetical protein
MSVASSSIRVAIVAALALAAVPRPGTAAQARPTAGAARVSVVPLFDVNKRFKPNRTFKLRFRAKETASGAALAMSDISFSLRRGAESTAVELPARQLGNGILEVPFKPEGPGRYLLVPSVLGVPASSIRPIRLGVVGMVDGLIEQPPEADFDVQKKAKKMGRRF